MVDVALPIEIEGKFLEGSVLLHRAFDVGNCRESQIVGSLIVDSLRLLDNGHVGGGAGIYVLGVGHRVDYIVEKMLCAVGKSLCIVVLGKELIVERRGFIEGANLLISVEIEHVAILFIVGAALGKSSHVGIELTSGIEIVGAEALGHAIAFHIGQLAHALLEKSQHTQHLDATQSGSSERE